MIKLLMIIIAILAIVFNSTIRFDRAFALNQVQKCACCDTHHDCGCEPMIAPCLQIFADMPPLVVKLLVLNSFEYFTMKDFLYSKDVLKDIFHPPEDIG